MLHFTPDGDPRLFACPCGRPTCGAPAPTHELLARLEAMRRAYGRPIAVTSGVRCAEHNRAVGGAEDSEHTRGEAADLACPTSRARWELLEAARAAGVLRLGIGATFLHVGVGLTLPQYVVWTYPSQA